MYKAEKLEKEVDTFLNDLEEQKKRWELEDKEFKKGKRILTKHPNKSMTDKELKKTFPNLYKLSKA